MNFQHWHLTLVAGMTNNILKTSVCHFHLPKIVSVVSISAEKVDGLRRSLFFYSNTSASFSALYCSKLQGMVLTAMKAEATLP